MVYEIDETVKYPVRFFVHGHPYKLLGIFPADIHLMGLDTADEEAPFYPFGSDRLERDMWSRMAYGTRISMSIGFMGVVLSLIFGIVLEGLSGYYGGMIDTVVQHITSLNLSAHCLQFSFGFHWQLRSRAIGPRSAPIL